MSPNCHLSNTLTTNRSRKYLSLMLLLLTHFPSFTFTHSLTYFFPNSLTLVQPKTKKIIQVTSNPHINAIFLFFIFFYFTLICNCFLFFFLSIYIVIYVHSILLFLFFIFFVPFLNKQHSKMFNSDHFLCLFLIIIPGSIVTSIPKS